MTTVQSAKNIVEKLQDACDCDVIEDCLDTLKKHLTETKEEFTTHEAFYENFVIAINIVRELFKNFQDQMTVLDTQIAGLEAQLNKAKNKTMKVFAWRDSALQHTNQLIKLFCTRKL